MKKTLTTLALVAVTAASFAQGVVNFGNSSSTLISAGGVAAPASSVSTFYFAVFMAPSTTVGTDFQAAPLFDDNRFSVANGYNVNHPTAAGRLQTTASALVLTGVGGGSTADFIVKGWSANAGTTYAEALVAFNSALPGAYFGVSRIGNNVVLGDGGAIPAAFLFGVGGSQVGGFNLAPTAAVPEPSSMALAGLGAASLLMFRRRK